MHVAAGLALGLDPGRGMGLLLHDQAEHTALADTHYRQAATGHCLHRVVGDELIMFIPGQAGKRRFLAISIFAIDNLLACFGDLARFTVEGVAVNAFAARAGISP